MDNWSYSNMLEAILFYMIDGELTLSNAIKEYNFIYGEDEATVEEILMFENKPLEQFKEEITVRLKGNIMINFEDYKDKIDIQCAYFNQLFPIYNVRRFYMNAKEISEEEAIKVAKETFKSLLEKGEIEFLVEEE